MTHSSKVKVPPDEHLGALVSRTKSGDREAFGELYELLVTIMYRYIYFRVGDDRVAEDLTHDVFVKAYRNIKQFKKGSVIAWFYTIGKNTVIDHYRKNGVKQRVMNELRQDTKLEEVPLEKDSLTRLYILKALDGLPETYRDVIIMRYLEDTRILD